MIGRLQRVGIEVREAICRILPAASTYGVLRALVDAIVPGVVGQRPPLDPVLIGQRSALVALPTRVNESEGW